MRTRFGCFIFSVIVLCLCGVSWGQKKASAPVPADGATDVLFPVLQWTAGSTAVFHAVYLGTTPQLGPADLVAPRQPLAQARGRGSEDGPAAAAVVRRDKPNVERRAP